MGERHAGQGGRARIHRHGRLGSAPHQAVVCGPSHPFGHAYVCVEEYALYISAPCELTSQTGAHGKPTATCVCEVINGPSFGQGGAPDDFRCGGQ